MLLRELSILSLGTLGIALAALACGAPTLDVATGSPAAQATDVRRTAVANVQRIIANNSTATPMPAATATPSPTCLNAMWWSEARSHIGESRTIQGSVVNTRLAAHGATMLEIGQPYPDPTGLAVLLPTGDAADVSGKMVCVAGHIALLEGRPALEVRNSTAIQVVN